MIFDLQKQKKSSGAAAVFGLFFPFFAAFIADVFFPGFSDFFWEASLFFFFFAPSASPVGALVRKNLL